MEVDIDAKLPKLEKHGNLRALAQDLPAGQDYLQGSGFFGRQHRQAGSDYAYLAAESEARENGTIAITPANYKFRYAGNISSQGGQHAADPGITPKKKAVGLFKGEIVDRRRHAACRCARSGQFVKTPSVFLKKIAFVRDYEIRNGVSVSRAH